MPVPSSIIAAPLPPVVSKERNLAIERFEQGFQALQQRDFGRATDLLSSMFSEFPDEKELHERARVYLAVCQRQTAPQDASPRTVQERVYAATLAANRGAFGESLRLLHELEEEDPSNDHVQYMLSVAHTLDGDLDEALAHLRRAIELNPDNQCLASEDIDLEPLHDVPDYLWLMETPAVRRTRRATPPPGFRTAG